MRQLEQTTQIAEENIPFENVIDLNEKVYLDGEIIIEEGTDGTEMYRLVESQSGLKVTIQGKEVGMIQKPGEYFGEMSAILKEKRSATVTSVGKSIIQVFNVDDLSGILETYPQLSKNIIDTLAKRLFETSRKVAAQHSDQS